MSNKKRKTFDVSFSFLYYLILQVFILQVILGDYYIEQ